MRIRPYRRSDAKAFAGLVRALARYKNLKPPTPAAARRLAADAGKRFRLMLAEVDGKPVAYALYFFTYSTFLAKQTLYLEDLFVLPTHRREGVGGKLFDALLREARRLKCGRMEWMVLDWNRMALRFYKKRHARSLKGWLPHRIVLK